jgi:cytochrome d ubiquinol oxidase subunit II
MTEVIIIAILGISILLYVLLGGADFGAGIVELITKNKDITTISRAIAPVWEANHIWLILAVVILFNGFPTVYTTLTTFLHIPLLLILIGIIVRGAAFSFRYYDPIDSVQVYYSWFFRIASLLTPFFLGTLLGAIMMGRIPLTPRGTFTELFISPWFNIFTFTTGIFLTILFGWLASVYLTGETGKENYHAMVETSLFLYILLIISGFSVFISAGLYHLELFTKFAHSGISIACGIVASILIPVMWRTIIRRKVFWTRFLAGVQTTCIIAGWFAVQFPVMVYTSGGNHLTIWNARAPEKTMEYLLLALLVGILIIFPAFAYLFKVFKFSAGDK